MSLHAGLVVYILFLMFVHLFVLLLCLVAVVMYMHVCACFFYPFAEKPNGFVLCVISQLFSMTLLLMGELKAWLVSVSVKSTNCICFCQ